jgi:hypothetical protein
MARESTIQIFNSVAGTTAPSDLAQGELAFAGGSDKLYIGKGSGVTAWIGAAILDEDTMSSDSDTALATQQSIKAYVNAQIGASAGVVSVEGLNGAIDLDANTGITLTTSGGDTITFSGTDATTSAKGVASFASDDFSVASGAVSLVSSVVKTVRTDTGGMPIADHGITFLGGEGMNVTHSGQEITIAGEDASTTNKGIASFDAGDFVMLSGKASLQGTVLKGITVGGSNVVPSNHRIEIDGGTAAVFTTSATGFTLGIQHAGTSTLGVASFSSDNFAVSAGGAVTIKDLGIANAELVNSSVTVNAGDGLATTSSSIDLGSGATLSVNVDDTTIEIATDALQVKDGGISNAKLTNSTISVSDGTGSTSISLGGGITFSGTATEIEVSETSGTVTIGLPTNVDIDGNLTVGGTLECVNLNVTGTTTTVDTDVLRVEDPLIKLARSNSSDTVDIGFYGQYNEGSGTRYTGLARDASVAGNKYYLFDELATDPLSGTDNVVDFGSASVATLVANINAGTF